ncbi:unnamed protein product [Ilex paraguariensis]|uniref:Saccharopine dehydrogenase NADP binding domain-containing protein n=1 Tax=Ilex paraguariensis TaxID=185542 RepID=A0ABC8UY73_9AQUA
MEETQNQSPTTTYDLIILGASGFTGKYVVREALKFLNSPSSPLKTIALAGRNPTKLAETLKWASHPNPPPQIPILTADTTDPPSLHRLAAQTKLILGCVGPFRLYGEPVVEACVDSGCDYLDICGEPEFMERVETIYHEKAVEKGRLVISACGFDSVPAELGLMFNSRQWVSPAVPNRVEAYLSLESEKRVVGNIGTYESAILGVANVEKLQELRRSRPRRARPVVSSTSLLHWVMLSVSVRTHTHTLHVYIYISRLTCPVIIDVFVSLLKRFLGCREAAVYLKISSSIDVYSVCIFYSWSFSFQRTNDRTPEEDWSLGCEATIGRFYRCPKNTHHSDGEPRGLPGSNESAEQIEGREAFWSTVKPAHFGVKIGSKSLLGIFRFISVGMFIGLLGKIAFGRWLLLKFPSFFSLGWFREKGPTEDEVASATFKMWFVGHGFSDSSLVAPGKAKLDMEIITRVMGPEIGYLTTPIILIQCALILLSQRGNLPKGGVFPPGIVFGPTDLQQRLQENGISFDVISKGALSA